MSAKIWVVAGGKGGVGKTFITSSLGLTLTKLKHTVLLVDFDCSGANLHTSLGAPLQEKNISYYFDERCSLKDLVTPTPHPKISHIQGFCDTCSTEEPTTAQIHKLIEDVKKLKFDFVVFDLGSGPRHCYLELFHYADEKFLVTTPEPTSLEKNYRFLENYFLFTAKSTTPLENFKSLKNCLASYRKSQKHVPFSFRGFLKQEANFQPDFFEQLKQNPVRLIVNCSRSPFDEELGYSIKSVCNKYYDIHLDYVGALDFDNAVWQSTREKSPVLVSKPFTPLAGQFLNMCKKLTDSNFQSNFYKAVV